MALDRALTGGATAADALRRMLAKLDIPPLEPVPESHVLTKSFYLLDRFPGRYDGGNCGSSAATARVPPPATPMA